MATETLDVAPAILIPFYDEDSSTVFLNGKGESSTLAYEIATDSPHLFQLSTHKVVFVSKTIDLMVLSGFAQGFINPIGAGL